MRSAVNIGIWLVFAGTISYSRIFLNDFWNAETQNRSDITHIILYLGIEFAQHVD